MLKDLINKAQQDDKEALLELIIRFNPILNKYAFKLNYEDAINDLIADFIEFIIKIKLGNFGNAEEANLIAYLRSSIRNIYTRRINNKLNQLSIQGFSSLSDSELLKVYKLLSAKDNHLSLLLYEFKSLLTPVELGIIYQLYINDIPISDLGKMYQISRQTMSKRIAKILKKLEMYYLEKNP